MSTKLNRKFFGVVLATLLMVIATGTASAWWSEWYNPNFSGSYSPSNYRHGQWNSSNWGGTEAFGSEMRWNQTRADGVRQYSNNRRWIWFCGNCYAYYTHDHTDMNNKLHARGYSTNFPGAVVDSDDDNFNGRHEEIEVTAVNSSFPTRDATYHFYSYFLRPGSGSGTVRETPAVSARNAQSHEYDTYRYDSYQSLPYSTTSLQEDDTEERNASPSVEIPLTEATYNSAGAVQITVVGTEGAAYLTVQSLPNSTDGDIALQPYVEWASGTVYPALQKSGIDTVLTVVTFRQAVPFEAVTDLLKEGTIIHVEALYYNQADPNPNSNIWTVGSEVEDGADFRVSLETITTDLTANKMEPGAADFTPIGVTAVRVWLPLSTVETLNNDSRVFLADASPTYLRWMALQQPEVVERLSKNDAIAPLLPDSLSPYIQTDVNHFYVYQHLAQPK